MSTKTLKQPVRPPVSLYGGGRNDETRSPRLDPAVNFLSDHAIIYQEETTATRRPSPSPSSLPSLLHSLLLVGLVSHDDRRSTPSRNKDNLLTDDEPSAREEEAGNTAATARGNTRVVLALRPFVQEHETLSRINSRRDGTDIQGFCLTTFI